MSISLSFSDKTFLLSTARRTIELFLTEQKMMNMAQLDLDESSFLRQPSGTFVTIYKKQFDADKTLRGCIGNIWPQKSLIEAVCLNAIAACSRDPRFSPVKLEELNDLKIEINILTKPETIASIKEIVLGRDGIILTKANRQSVFLPSVATEYGWSLEETLSQLAVKAGLRANDWQKDVEYCIFQSEILSELI